jgi:hypothetical protein
MRICFIDTETTGLDRRRRRLWDFACIVRDIDEEGGYTDKEHQFFIQVSLKNADPFALNIGHFWQRFPGWQVRGQQGASEARHNGTMIDPWSAAKRIHDLTVGAIWVGSVPSFDEESCAALLRKSGLVPRWDYHLVDVETAGAALAGISPPWKNDIINEAYNIVIPPENRHTALGDARAVRDLYDAVFKP